MPTINTLLANDNTAIRLKVSINSINQADVADQLDGIVNELLLRGIRLVASTGALVSETGADLRYAIVPDVGIFAWQASGVPNGTTIFAGATGVWVLILAAFSGTYPSIALDALSDVVITTPTTGQVLVFNGTNWINSSPTSGGGGPDTIPPVIISASVITPNIIRLIMSEPVTNTGSTGLGVFMPTSNVIESVGGNGTFVLDLFMQDAIGLADVVTLNYNSAAGNMVDASGNEMVSFTDLPVLNALYALAPKGDTGTAGAKGDTGTSIKGDTGDAGPAGGGGINKDQFVLAANGNRALSLGSVVMFIRVVPQADLAAFRVGSTANGEEWSADQPITTAGIIITFFRIIDVSALYFYGITSSTNITIWYA